MKIECFLAEGCGSKEQLMQHIERALREDGIDADVLSRQVSQEEAKQMGIGGSPIVWVDGRDLEEGAPPGGIA
jgi:hypothetical protein